MNQVLCPTCKLPSEVTGEGTIFGNDFYALKCKHRVNKKSAIEIDQPFQFTPTKIEPAKPAEPDSGVWKFQITDEKYEERQAPKEVEVEELTVEEKDTRLDDITSLDEFKYKLKEYQKVGILKAEAALLNGEKGFLFGDEPGVGKTNQAIGLLKLHPELCPALFVVKTTLKAQFLKEILRWLGPSYIPQMILTGEDVLIPGFKIYITSFDLLWRTCDEKQIEVKDEWGLTAITTDIKSPFRSFNFNSVFVDECQYIKNSASKRSREVTAVAEKARFTVGLSGTPISNHAAEYFPILHLIKPSEFKLEDSYQFKWVDKIVTEKGYVKFGGIRNWEKFKDIIDSVFIRRTRKEVLPELPTVTRQFQYVDFDNEKLQAQYDKVMVDFLDAAMNDDLGTGIEYLSRMRHICGLAKIGPTVELVSEFLEGTDRKIVIFTHHIDVMDSITELLGDFCELLSIGPPLKLHSGLDVLERQALIERFKEPENRVMIASTLASGEGLNMQFCSDCVIVERQWTPAKEEQAEGRFIRIGQAEDKVTAVYMISNKTIDQTLTELVEHKRAIMAQTLDGESAPWDENSLLAELTKVLLNGRNKRQVARK